MVTGRVLVVDDEPAVRSILERVLRKEGYTVLQAVNGKEGLQAVQEQYPDVMILDLNMPDISGEAVCKLVRKNQKIQSIPILILTGQTKDGLPAECLDGGADDYLSKPFDIKELVARVRALLRRPRVYAAADTVLKNGRISIRTSERQVLVKGHTVPDLTPKEFELLSQLVLHAPRVLERNILALKVWGLPLEQVNPRTLDVHVRRIRQKLGHAAAVCLKTVPAIGFQWSDHSAVKAATS
jgi:DNA-binding response OmpR family regulator